MEENTNLKEQDIQENEGQAKEPETKPTEKPCTIFGKWDKSIMARREAKEKKKEEKKKAPKGSKAAKIGGAVVIGGTVLYGIGKAVVNHFASGGDCTNPEMSGETQDNESSFTSVETDIPSEGNGEA